MTKKPVRLRDLKPKGSEFVYRPPENVGPPMALDATLGVKFAQTTRILDDWYLLGGTRWSRGLFRLRHPIVYSKRGLRNLWRRIKRYFFGDPPAMLCRKWVTKEELLNNYPHKKENTYGTDQTKEQTIQPDQGID